MRLYIHGFPVILNSAAGSSWPGAMVLSRSISVDMTVDLQLPYHPLAVDTARRRELGSSGENNTAKKRQSR